LTFIIKKYTEVESTNTTAKELIKENTSDSHGIFVIADRQKNGRGRYKREWISDEGNIFLSIILKEDKLGFEDKDLLPFIVAIFLNQTLSEYLDKCKIKWPNDILVNEKKISGILIETYKNNDDLYYIIGIGINNMFFPQDMLYPATSLKHENVIVKNEEIVNKLMNNFQTIENKDSFVSDRTKIISSWKENASGIDKKIEVKQMEKTINGIFKDIDLYGNLILEKENKEIENISAGDIFMLD